MHGADNFMFRVNFLASLIRDGVRSEVRVRQNFGIS